MSLTTHIRRKLRDWEVNALSLSLLALLVGGVWSVVAMGNAATAEMDNRAITLEQAAQAVAAAGNGQPVRLAPAPDGASYKLIGEAGEGPWCLEMSWTDGSRLSTWDEYLHMTHEDTEAQDGACPLVVGGDGDDEE